MPESSYTYEWEVTDIKGHRMAMVEDGEISNDPTNTAEELDVAVSELLEAKSVLNNA